MEVYEVMFIAIPLWFCLVGFLASLVFGSDMLNAFKAKQSTQKVLANQPKLAPTEPKAWREREQAEVARKGERELVLH